MRRTIHIYGNYDSKHTMTCLCHGDVNDRGQIVDSPGDLGEDVYEEIEKQLAEGRTRGTLSPRDVGEDWPVTYSWEFEDQKDKVADAIRAVLEVIEATYCHNSRGERCDGDPENSGADIVEMLCGIESLAVEAAEELGILPPGYGEEGEQDEDEDDDDDEDEDEEYDDEDDYDEEELYMNRYMKNIRHIAPDFRIERNALEFGKYLLKHCYLTPEQFGDGYLWEKHIPPKDRWEREVGELNLRLIEEFTDTPTNQ